MVTDDGDLAAFLGKRFAPDPSIVAREIGGELILVPIRHTAREVASIYTMNRTGCRIWELLDGERQAGQIRDQVVAEFEVEAEEAGRDLAAFLRQLVRAGAVQEV